MQLHHLALGARDVEKIAGFYATHFGLAELARHLREDGSLRSVWLELGSSVLMVEATEEGERRCGVGAGLFLLALRATPSERRALEARLSAAGIAVESRTDFTSYFRDPEGNRFAISHYPER
jgi:catechol 2,3-dioxygenase-like lactoylglutathione lyase family enzyme